MKTLASLAAVAAVLSLKPVAADAAQFVEVTVVNATHGQIFSPPVVAVHQPSARIFEVGAAASAPVAALATDGVTDGLVAALAARHDVEAVLAAAAPILPGDSATYTLEVTGRGALISVVAMLVSSNDAFLGIDSAPLPQDSATASLHAVAYDAGVEENSESCAHVPGPPCGTVFVGLPEHTGNVRVHVHPGIRGDGDLDAAIYDWRNPVATVTVRRVRN